MINAQFEEGMRISRQNFGETEDGKEVLLFTLRNTNGIIVSITNYGGIISSILLPGRFGAYDNVVLGFRRFKDYISEVYLSSYPYLGAICGRYVGRIRDGKFSINGTDYQLAQNDGPNHVHGGLQVYSGYYTPELNGKYGRYGGIALETQHLPDSPNHPGFPDTILMPGEVYNENTLFKFIVDA